jgi:hypothetical protein
LINDKCGRKIIGVVAQKDESRSHKDDIHTMGP